MTFACSVKHEKINEIHADFSNLFYLSCLSKITTFVVFKKAFRKAVCSILSLIFRTTFIQLSNGYILIQRFAQSIGL